MPYSLADVRGMSPEHAGLGYAAFAATMTVCRLTRGSAGQVGRPQGDRHRRVAGRRDGPCTRHAHPILAGCAAGYALVGVGCSNIVPVMFSLAGKQDEMPESIAVPAITTMGYAGGLAGAGVDRVRRACDQPRYCVDDARSDVAGRGGECADAEDAWVIPMLPSYVGPDRWFQLWSRIRRDRIDSNTTYCREITRVWPWQ